ncbi:TonB-dependent receptor plug domain-containing protein [Hyphobacterium sp.]|uniref:TonB-dependent receptor plug domain-containing protein n=1 Tax=Hyphobacterium sp. TaxID=2004662 RepID=UPI003BAB0214
MFRKYRLWGSCALIALLPSAALAQEAVETEETIIVIGGRIPVPESDLTSAVTLVNEDDIELRGTFSLTDTLRAVPGVAVSRQGGRGNLTDLRVRGSETNHVLVLIDGIEASVPMTGGYDFAHAPGFGVESVEVLRGEQSALWGSDAIGGVINIQSTGASGRETRQIQVEGGSFGTWQAGARFADEHGRLSSGISASRLQTDGIDVSGLGGEEDGYQRFSASLTGRFSLGENESIQWTGRFADFESEFDSDSDFDGRLDDNNRVSNGQQLAAGVRVELYRGGFGHALALNHTTDRLENYADAAFSSETEAQRLQAFYQPTLSWQTGAFAHQLSGLVEFERETFDSFAGAGAGSNQSQAIDNTAAAFDYRLSRGPARISASVRQNWNDRFEDAATWRIGGAYLFEGIDGRARASFGEGIKNPGVFELFGFFPNFFAGNPNLQPERSRGWEIGWDQSFGDTARLSVTWFESELKDEIFTDFSVFPSTARNRSTPSDRSGFELEGEVHLTPHLTLAASASFIDSEENGQPEIRRPEMLGSVSLNWRSANNRFAAGIAADHTGEQRDTDFGTFTQVTLPAYTLVSARFGWQVTDDVQLFVRSTNLTDEETTDVFGYASEGRAVFVGVRFGR